MNFLITFIILSVINVVFSTIRSITTIKSGKLVASLISGGYFAFYNVMLIWTVADFSMWQKCLITFVCNVVGVYIVKFAEEKMRKDKLWLVKVTITPGNFDEMVKLLNHFDISYSYVDITKYIVFDTYYGTQKETALVSRIAKQCGGKLFATENKL